MPKKDFEKVCMEYGFTNFWELLESSRDEESGGRSQAPRGKETYPEPGLGATKSANAASDWDSWKQGFPTLPMLIKGHSLLLGQ